MKYKLSDLVDVDRLQELMDDFYQVTEAPTAILEADGAVLTATAWQPICTEFHRVCPELAARCAKSDAYIAAHLDEGKPYVVYECANGLVDVAAPIIVEGEHIGTVFTGQFLFEEPDVERFRKQAQAFDLDEEAYLAALADVPIVSRERLEPLLTYLSKFAEMLADIGLERLESELLEKEMGESEAKLRAIFSAMPDIVMVLDREGRYIEIAPTNPDLLYKPSDDLAGQLMHDVLPEAAADAYLEQIHRVLDSGEPEDFEYTLPVQLGEVTFFATITPLTEDRVVWVARDISERKQAEAERERFTRRLNTAADIATQVNTILDPDELLEAVIPLIKERFGLYYVHVYTVDEESDTLNLRAGYGEAGEKMLAEGHSIPLDRAASLVATAARTKEPVLVNDVTENPNFMPNPLLPDTRAEVAVPAIAGDEVLGVFDVQHDEKNYFTDADLDAFRTLAGQIATAFRNAQIFEAQAEAEAEARRSAAQRAALLDAIPDLMFRFDSDGVFLDYKAEAGAKLLAPPEAFLGHHVSEVLPPSLAKMTLEHLEQALQTGEPVTYEYQAPVGDEMHDYEARMAPSGDDEVLALIRDITEQKQAEAQLAASEQQFRSLFESMTEGVALHEVLYNDDGEAIDYKILDINPAYTAFTGLPKEAVVDAIASELYGVDEPPYLELYAKVAETREPESFEVYFPPMEKHFSINVFSPTEGQFVTVFNDVTEQRQAQAERERFTTRLDTAAQISEQVGSILDPDELLETVIPLIKERFGLYYVHVYTLDEESGQLNLRAGYGEAGEKMLAEGHSIPLDREASLVATAARTKEPVLVDDVTENPNFMPNPLLPDTKTEVAVPAIAGGRVLGVFDVQHDESHYFTDADVDVFTTLAAQIANALRSAELYETAEDERAFYDGIIEALPIGVWAVNNQFKPLLVNQAGRAMMGREVKDQDGGAYVENYEVINVETGELYDNTELPLVKAVTQGGEYMATDAGVRHPDGTVVPQLINAAPLFDAQGEQMGGVVVFSDMTEQREAQEAIRESQIKFQTIADYTYDWEYWLGPEDEFLYVSPACEKITGYTADEFMENPHLLDEIVHPDDRELLHRHMHAYHENPAEVETAEDAAETEFRIFTKDGEVRWIGHACRPVYGPEGEWIGRRASNRDATEAVKARESLAQNEERLSLALESGRVGIWEFWPASQEVYYNPTWYTMLGYEPDELPQDLSTWAELLHPEDAERANQTFGSSVAAGEDFAMQFRMKTKDGNWRWIQAYGYITERTSGGAAERVIGTHTDITEQKLAEMERERFIQRLDTAAQISEQVGSILNPDELLETVIPLIKERFGLYYVHVYTLDEESGQLNLRAGYGEAGEKMLAEGHSIPLDREASLVATAARTKEPVLVDDVTENPNFMPNPLLPDTKTEVAVPAIAGGRVLGVFDVQHDESHYFTDADVDVFTTLAAQIANAFRSAEIVDTLNLTQFSVDRGPAAIYWMRPDASLFDVNETACRMLGYSREELLAMERFTDLDPNFPPEAWAGHWEELKEKQRMTIQTEHRAKDGTIVPVEVEVNYLKYGDQEFDCAFARDISERLEAEERLRANEERLSLALESGRVGIWEFWPQKNEVYYNPTWYTMLGYEPDELPQELSTWAELLHPDDAERASGIVMDGVQTGEDFHLQFRMKTKEGGWRWIQAHGYVTELTPEGAAARTIGTHTDITERKLAEMERERFTQRLDTAAQISEQVGSILDPDELLETVIPLIKEQFGLYYVHVYTLDEKSGTLNLRAGYGEAGEKMLAEGHSIPLDREASLVATAARTKEPVLVDDVTENPNFMPNPLLPDTRTEVAVPSIAGGKVLGVFDVQHDESHYFTDADVDVFTTLAGQIANAFQSAELFEQAERSLRETEVRLAVSQALAEAETESHVWSALLEHSGLYPEAAIGLYAFEEENGKKIQVTRAFSNFDTDIAEEPVGTRFPADEFEVTALVAGGEQVIIDNIFTDNRMGAGMREDAHKLGYVSLAATPITVGNTIIGLIVAHSPEEAYFDDAKLNLYATLADQGGGALEAARLQQAIRESQIKFQTVADYTYDWEYWLGPEDEFLYVSPACEKITGYTADEFMENPHLLDEIVHPDDRELLHRHMHAYHENPAEVATAEDAAETEFRIFTKDGEVRWIGHACRPVYGPEGEWIGRRASNRDATEAVKARESLAQNEERLSLALESGRVGIWEFWPASQEVYYNPTWYTMLGYEPDELPQDLSTWAELLHPEDAERANQTFGSSVAAGEDFAMQFRMKTKDGNWRWIQAYGYITERTSGGAAERVIGTHTDITERKLAEAEQARLSAVLEATTDFVGIATPDGKGVYFNQAAREMVGIPSDIDPSEYEIVSFTPERELERTQDEILPTAMREGAWTGESFLRTLEGEEIPVLMTIISITDEAGNLQYLANVARDITDIREAREAQARFAAQLETAAEIATRVNALLDPDELFDLVIPLTKERFNLYHVHFYAFDPESEVLNLRAGYGRAGELMLRQGHQIPFDRERSIVARAARDRDLVVVNDVTAEPEHLPNMLLPDTKSEVAVPAIVGDELLGVLDVQADEVDFFTASDLDVYRTLVGQIATAYQNARYFERQHESEAALRESAEKIRAIFNAITDGISVTNMTGEITDLNAALLDLHGYEQRDELLGRNTMELIARDDWSTATQNINHTLDTGSSRNAEMLLVRQGGDVFDGEVSTALLQDDEGNPTGIISVVRDITQRKRREAALRLTRASVDNAEDEIFWFDDEGNFFDVNRAACEILGYTREELLEMRIFDIDPDFPEEAWPGLLAQVREKGAITLTSQHMTKEGVIFPVEVTVNYLKFGDQEFIFSFAHDITERQQVEEERRRFTTQLRTAAEVAAQINTILDPQELLAEVVPMVQERFDLYHVHVYIIDEETNELVMRVGTGEAGRVMLEERHKIALDRAKSLVARAARSRQPVLVNDVTQDPDFMPNPLLPDTKSEVAVPAVAGDRVIGVFDVQDDERNRFAESDLDVFTTLASQIAIAFQNAQYFEEVQRTAERLREVDRLKGEFLANMSHELRTPLNSILGYTEVILMGIDGPLNDEMTEDIDAIHKNGKHLLRLINDILDLTKIEAGRLKLEQEEVYLAPLFDDVRTNNIGYFHKQKTGIDFRVKVFDEDMRVYADRVRLTQILNNLVSNAAKFTDEGFVEMRAYREGDWACLEVEDTGIGIEDDDLNTVFERFRQVDGSNARRAEGTGLGLAITKHLVEMHGGHLEVHSEPGKGSIFSAYLPIYDPEAEATAETAAV